MTNNVETPVVETEEVAATPVKKLSWLDRTFGLTKNGTNVRTEVMAGITTFMAMVYILMVNAGMFATEIDFGNGFIWSLGVSYGAIYIATAISAVIGTVLIGLLAKLPLAQASGMGLNAFFVFTICLTFGLTYANALVMVLFDGILFLILTVTGLRKQIFEAIPKAIRSAIPAGIGLFIAFIGFQNSKIIIPNSSTGVSMGSLNLLAAGGWVAAMPLIVTIVGVVTIAILSAKGVKGAILYGIVGSAVLYYLLGLTTGMYVGENALVVTLSNPFDAFKAFGTEAVGKVFTEGFDFSGYLAIDGNSTTSLVVLLITSALAFCIVDMFDTIGTLFGACSRGNLLTENGEIPNMNKALLADAIATTVGAVCGTSTVTTFVESSAGVAEGGRTGLTSIVVAIGFAIAMFLSPIAQLIPSVATATALIYVGVLMMNSVKEIDWLNPAVALPSFLTIAMMSFSYNISFGIGMGIISYTAIMLFTGKAKEVKVGTYVLCVLFLAMFLLTH